ncbi:MAG: hypothetical protein FWD15_04225 [Alphaproteobacteria bacterium]|nr:hypothetical protein [Alphaproteobacteria bacterium]
MLIMTSVGAGAQVVATQAYVDSAFAACGAQEQFTMTNNCCITPAQLSANWVSRNELLNILNDYATPAYCANGGGGNENGNGGNGPQPWTGPLTSCPDLITNAVCLAIPSAPGTGAVRSQGGECWCDSHGGFYVHNQTLVCGCADFYHPGCGSEYLKCSATSAQSSTISIGAAGWNGV